MVENVITKDQLSNFITLPVENFDNNSIIVSETFQSNNKNNALFKTSTDRPILIININNVNFNDLNVLPQVLEIQNLGIAPTTTELPQSVVEPSPPDGTEETLNPPSKTKPNPSYKCGICMESFEKLTIYRKHVLSHKTIKKFKCEKCHSSYNVESNLQIHMALHCEGTPKCPICNTEFHRWASLKSHLLVHQVEELYTCDECKAEFEKEEELNKHITSHIKITNGGELYCTHCRLEFDNSKLYKEHIAEHAKIKKMALSWRKSRKSHGNREYAHVCGVCRKSFAKASLLERHSRVHSGERPFVCPNCKKGFNQKGTLQIHMSKHLGEKPFVCTLCSAKFNQKGNLRVHVEKTHIPQTGVKTYKCTHCPCIFKKLASLNVHITKTHPIEKDSGNDINLLMTQLKDLEQQSALVPGGMKPAEKDVAEQNKKILWEMIENQNSDGPNISYVRLAESFLDGSVRRYLVKQKKVNDVKLYICNYCDKEFKKPSDLIRHTRVHTREKPFKCKECGATFSLKSSLYCHVKTHAGNNNYVCPYCLKKFSTMRSVNLHVKKHLDDAAVMKDGPIIAGKVSQDPQNSKNSVDSGMQSAAVLKKNKIFSCSQCDDTFPNVGMCQNHINNHDALINPVLMTAPDQNAPQDDQIEQQMYEIHSGAIIQDQTSDADQIPTIFINLPQDNNFQKIHQHHDSLLFNSLGDLSDVNVFNIDPISSDLETQSPYIYPNQIFNQFLTHSNSDQNKTQTIVENSKDKEAITESPLIDLNLALNGADQSFPVDVSIPSPTLLPTLESQTVFGLEPTFVANTLVNTDTLTNDDGNNTSGSEWEQKAPIKTVKKKKFTCPQCKKVFVSKSTYNRHVKSHSSKDDQAQVVAILHQCMHCPKGFKKHSDLKRHLRTHTGEKPFPCDKCEKRFSLKSTLLSHQRTHNPISHKNYNCTVCNSFFTSKSSLTVHRNLHTGHKPHQCNYCPSAFRTAAHKKSHEATQHTNPVRSKKVHSKKVTNLLATVAMDVVNSQDPTLPTSDNAVTNQDLLENILVVQDPSQLSSHDLNLPLSEPIHLDPSILQQLQSSNFLFQDQLITSLIQLDNGTLLNIRTDNLDDLNASVTNDEGVNVVVEKPRNLECEICHKKYASKDVLRKHKKTHGIFRKFPCTKCDKGFDTEDALEKHEKVHAGYRPYTCQICENSFSKEHSLATHMKRIHAPKPVTERQNLSRIIKRYLMP